MIITCNFLPPLTCDSPVINPVPGQVIQGVVQLEYGLGRKPVLCLHVAVEELDIVMVEVEQFGDRGGCVGRWCGKFNHLSVPGGSAEPVVDGIAVCKPVTRSVSAPANSREHGDDVHRLTSRFLSHSTILA